MTWIKGKYARSGDDVADSKRIDRGTLTNITAPEFGAAAIHEALKRTAFSPEKVGTAVMGQAVQAGSKVLAGDDTMLALRRLVPGC